MRGRGGGPTTDIADGEVNHTFPVPEVEWEICGGIIRGIPTIR